MAREFTALAEYELGLGLGPFRLTRAPQLLEGGREVNHLYATYAFDVGETAAAGALTEPWSFSAFTRLTRHKWRAVKSIRQTGAALSYFFGQADDAARFVVEAEASLAPVESLRNRPLSDDVEHNNRTQDELFWTLYFGQRRCVTSAPGLFVDVRAGVEAFYENDERVHPAWETGWFFGVKWKLGLWRRGNRLVGYGFNLVGGQDTFGFNYGAEAAVSTRL
ncbi:MAG: hypothetical protein HZB55_20440 [Deltaproteobacteria bacterium]|nr:hypothetical protein [Deltaproteobacteria bacterium]